MKRISTVTKAVDLFGAGKHGWKDGNLLIAVQATDGEADWFNNLQEEVANVIENNGIALDGNVRTQLYQAIQAMIAGAANNAIKIPVRFTTTGNIVLSGLGTQAGGDWGGALTAGDRILGKDQATGADRGIYIAAAGAWARATDADGVGELPPGALVVVQEGATLADSVWELSTDGPITIGTTALTFGRKDGSTSKQLYGGSVSVAANALTVSLDPCTTDFRSAVLNSGAPVTVTSGSALSLTVPTGASLGLPSGALGRFAVLEINAAGTKEVAIVYPNGGISLDQSGLISTTAISAGANSANVVYSQTARANVAYKVKLFLDISEAVAGTWATAPTLVYPSGDSLIKPAPSIVRLNTNNGYGSTNNKIGRFTNVVQNVGTDITYTDSATLGASFTINAPGFYAFSAGICFNAGQIAGLSLNTSAPTTSIGSIPLSEVLSMQVGAANQNWSWAGFLPAGSVVRPHYDGGSLSVNPTVFTAARIG